MCNTDAMTDVGEGSSNRKLVQWHFDVIADTVGSC
jgi:hypothetical protein